MSKSAPSDAGTPAGNRRRPIAIDLFAGAGGLSLGLEQAGFDVVAAVEYDPVHAAAHKFNFPHTEVLCGDVAKLDADVLRAAAREGCSAHGRDTAVWNGEIDLVAGGPPCQGFSLIGRRLLDDPRNRLVFHFFRLVDALRPRYFVLENVPGMATGGHAGILHELIAEFERVGYRFPTEERYRVLDAAGFGVPQARRRLFLIGTREDRAAPVQPPSASVRPVPKRPDERLASAAQGGPEADLPRGPNVWEAIGDLPNVSDFPSLCNSDETTLSAKRLEFMERLAGSYARMLRGLQDDLGDLSYPRSRAPAVLTASTRTEHTDESIARFKATSCGQTEPVSRFYKLHPDGLCNTLRAGSGSERGAFTSPRPLHPRYPRVLSNREAARLHSFPDWFRPHTTKWHGFRQIGNSVPPLLGRAVGAQIVAALGLKPGRPETTLELGDTELLSLTMSQAVERLGADPTSIPAGRLRSPQARHARARKQSGGGLDRPAYEPALA